MDFMVDSVLVSLLFIRKRLQVTRFDEYRYGVQPYLCNAVQKLKSATASGQAGGLPDRGAGFTQGGLRFQDHQHRSSTVSGSRR